MYVVETEKVEQDKVVEETEKNVNLNGIYIQKESIDKTQQTLTFKTILLINKSF